MNDPLSIVLNGFPDFHQLVSQIYENDDEFRELCRDYADALKAIQYWQQSDNAVAPMRVKEYQSLVRDLEGDIRKWLDRNNR